MCQIPERCQDCPHGDHVRSLVDSLLLSQSQSSVSAVQVVDELSDLVQSLQDEIERSGLKTPYPLSYYDQANLEEKSGYFFQIYDTIMNKKAYLTKLIASLRPETQRPTKTTIKKESFRDEERRKEKEEKEKEEKRHAYLDTIMHLMTDDMIRTRMQGHVFLTNYCKSVENVRSRPDLQYAFIEILIKDGIVKC